jgi:hypothetical protein
MCTQTDSFPLGAVEIARIVARAASRVAARTGAEESDLRVEGHVHLPRFVREWSPGRGVSPGGYLGSRLRWVMLDVAKRELRRGRFHGAVPEDVTSVVGGMWGDGGAEAAGSAEDRVLARQLLSASRLSGRELRVVMMRFWSGAENGEISAELGVSVATVERAMASALVRLRRAA